MMFYIDSIQVIYRDFSHSNDVLLYSYILFQIPILIERTRRN